MSNRCSGAIFASSSRPVISARSSADGRSQYTEADAETRRVLLESLVERFPRERIDELRIAARHQAELRFGDEIADDPQELVPAPANADVAFAVHAKQPPGRAEHQVAHFVAVGVVVVLEAVVIDHLDAEAVAAVLLTQRREQPLFAELAAIEQRPSVATHPAEQRLALLELDAFLAQLLDDVQEHLVPVLDLVADREVERFKAGADQFELRRADSFSIRLT